MLENFKQKLRKQTLKRCVIADLDGEEVYLKKGGFLKEWGRIYPTVSNENKINWVNLIFGGWRNLIKLIFVMLILIGFYGLLGDARQYMDGDKYVIINKTSFDKFCSLSIEEGHDNFTGLDYSIVNLNFSNSFGGGG